MIPTTRFFYQLSNILLYLQYRSINIHKKPSTKETNGNPPPNKTKHTMPSYVNPSVIYTFILSSFLPPLYPLHSQLLSSPVLFVPGALVSRHLQLCAIRLSRRVSSFEPNPCPLPRQKETERSESSCSSRGGIYIRERARPAAAAPPAPRREADELSAQKDRERVKCVRSRDNSFNGTRMDESSG